MKGLILAGGKGTRLRPLTHTGAKQLIPVAGKPIICYVIEDLVSAGIKDIGIIVGYTPERIQSIKDGIGDEKNFGARLTYIEQGAPQGLAHAVLCAREFLGEEPFTVYLGDNMLENGIGKFISEFSSQKPDASILLTRVQNPEMYGIAYLDEKGNLLRVEEKPKSPKANTAIIGVYLFTNKIFQAIPKIKPSKRGELEITDAIEEMLKAGQKVTSHIVDGWWDDTGTPEAILSVNAKVLASKKVKEKNEGQVQAGARLSGKLSIGKGTKIDSHSEIIGPVCIGENCKIENSKIGSNVSVGRNCTLANTKISNSLILDGVEISYPGELSQTIIGNNTKILSKKGGQASLIVGENSILKL